MKKDFKQWKDDYGLEFEPNYSKETELDCKAAFEAGQQSKQAEVDELRKRIDDALNKSEDFYDFGDGESAMAFCNEIINILKGKINEH